MGVVEVGSPREATVGLQGQTEGNLELGRDSLHRHQRRMSRDAERKENCQLLSNQTDQALYRESYSIFPVFLRDRHCCPHFVDEDYEAQRG